MVPRLRRAVCAVAVVVVGVIPPLTMPVQLAVAAPARATGGSPGDHRTGLPTLAPAPVRTHAPTAPDTVTWRGGHQAEPCQVTSFTTPTTSTCWSGYVHQGSGFTDVSATWTVPTVTAGASGAKLSTWVGIDGWNSTSLIQTGTGADVNASNGTTHYYAWFEVLPAQPVEQVQFDVSPGDAIYAAISQTSSTQWLIVLIDRTNGQSISTTQTYSGPQSAADFIQEAPLNVSTNTVFPLASYTTFTFFNARVNSSPAALTTSQTVSLVQNGTQVSTPSVPNEAQNGFAMANSAAQPATPITPVFQLHNDGTLWASTGVSCSGASCPGWVKIDSNRSITQVAAGAGTVYQRHQDGSIWEWTGTPCGASCSGWIQLDGNSSTTAISAGSGTVFQLHSDGSIWRSTGIACTPTACPGWTELDNNPSASAISAGAGSVFQRHSDGSIWLWTGVPCGSGCPGWVELDNNSADISIAAGASSLFQFHSDHSIWRATGTLCSNGACPGWVQLDNNAAAKAISAGGTVYQLHTDGTIWQSTGTACANGCPGWTLLDNNAETISIAASSTTVYQLHADGSIWQSTGTACSGSSCPGWVELDNNSAALLIAVSNGS